MKKLTILAVLLLGFSLTVFAQEKSTQEAPAFTPPPPLNNEFLNWMVGEWEGWSESAMGKTSDHMTCSMALNNQFMLIGYQAKAENMTYEGRGAMTLAADGQVKGFWIDNMRSMSQGKGTLAGNILTMEWNTPGMGKGVRITERINENKFKVTEKWTMPDGNVMESRSEMTRAKATSSKY